MGRSSRETRLNVWLVVSLRGDATVILDRFVGDASVWVWRGRMTARTHPPPMIDSPEGTEECERDEAQQPSGTTHPNVTLCAAALDTRPNLPSVSWVCRLRQCKSGPGLRGGMT